MGKSKKYTNISLSVRLQVAVAKQDVRNKMTKINTELNAEGIFYIFIKYNSQKLFSVTVSTVLQRNLA